jgi:coniferyl-aldehyde dehydrogenase
VRLEASAMTPDEVTQLFELQRAASRADQTVALEVRRDRLERAMRMLVRHCDRLCEAMSQDFGHRSKEQSLAIDVGSVLDSLKFARRHVARWMRPERRGMNFPTGLFGARLEVRYRPLGTVCILGAWNFPAGTVLAPLVGALAAGNRAMLKPSEMTPQTAEALRAAVTGHYAPDEVAVVTGGPEIGRTLTALPFDRIAFTGGATTARHIMRSAADHLTPLTLELGGKSPVIVGRSASLPEAARQIMFGKLFNAGQACVAPDYALVPRELEGALEQQLVGATRAMFARLAANPDYSSIATEAHFARLHELLADAIAQGAREVVINPAGEELGAAAGRRMAPRLLFGVKDSMRIMQQEIFGPILPVRSYERLDDAIAYVNARPRPLALYFFGRDPREEAQVLERTVSGGVTVNDTILHAAQEDAPFGGVGESGFGHYRGFEGFKQFSTAQTVMKQSRLNLAGLLRPPYDARKQRLLRALIR